AFNFKIVDTEPMSFMDGKLRRPTSRQEPHGAGIGSRSVAIAATMLPAQTLGRGANWQSITTTPLPLPRAHHGMAEADPGNSLVPVDKRFIYVIGGQENSAETPGGTNTIFMASVDPTTGGVGTWTQLSTNLPESLVGPAVAIF